jgi:type I restriction enzyme, S subunit
MNVILSIKPKYAQLILSGAKRYEFRKSIFSEKYVHEAYIYATEPIKRIIGLFEIGDIIRDSPECLWDKLGLLSGMNETEFFDYFRDAKIGFAIEIKHVEVFKVQRDPKELIPGFNPPQSFCYLKYSLVPECTATKGYIESRIPSSK